MTDDRIEGALRQGVGHVQDAVGGLTGDGETQVRGKLNEAAGAAQDALGQARNRAQDLFDGVEDYARREPLATLAVTLGLGLGLGLLLRGGRKTVYVRR